MMFGTGHIECFGDGDSFTFTAPSGKKFTRIEMADEDGSGNVCGDANWSLIEFDTKLVWSGTPSSTVTIAGDGLTKIEKLTSIVFTLVDE